MKDFSYEHVFTGGQVLFEVELGFITRSDQTAIQTSVLDSFAQASASLMSSVPRQERIEQDLPQVEDPPQLFVQTNNSQVRSAQPNVPLSELKGSLFGRLLCESDPCQIDVSVMVSLLKSGERRRVKFVQTNSGHKGPPSHNANYSSKSGPSEMIKSLRFAVEFLEKRIAELQALENVLADRAIVQPDLLQPGQSQQQQSASQRN